MTMKGIYNLKSQKIKRFIPFKDICGITVSSVNYVCSQSESTSLTRESIGTNGDELVLHVRGDYDFRYKIVRRDSFLKAIL